MTIADRRSRPNNGYRAAHVIVSRAGKLVEIQVRTRMQQGWAELSEKVSDVIDPAIKSGSGDETAVQALLQTSELIAAQESKEARFAELESRAARLLSLSKDRTDEKEELAELRKMMDDWKRKATLAREEIVAALEDMLEDLSPKEIDNAVSD